RAMSDPRRVVIAGGGVAGLETLIGLRETAAERLEITLLSPDPLFTYRPLDVGEPFGLGHPRHYPLAEIVAAQGGAFHEDGVTRVDHERSRVLTGSGAELEYDALVLAIGARPVPSHEHGIVFSKGLDRSEERRVGKERSAQARTMRAKERRLYSADSHRS